MERKGNFGIGTATVRFYLDKTPLNDEFSILRSFGKFWMERHRIDRETRLNDFLFDFFPNVKGTPVLQLFFAYRKKNDAYNEELLNEYVDFFNNKSTVRLKKIVLTAFPEGFENE